MRIDVALVQKSLFETRSKAKEAILSGIIFYNKKCITKPSFDVLDMDLLSVRGNVMPYVSRGGLKLEKAISSFNINLTNRIMIDIGSSTGGFSDCALQHGIKKIIAVDTGTNQMHHSLRNNDKILLFEQTDFRQIDDAVVADIDIATIDVSFISVTKILDKLKTLPNLMDVVCLIKPQFECGKEIADKYRGVVLNRDIHKNVIDSVLFAFNKIGFSCVGLTFSPIAGGSGNIEYLAYFKKQTKININHDVDFIVKNAFDTLLGRN